MFAHSARRTMAWGKEKTFSLLAVFVIPDRFRYLARLINPLAYQPLQPDNS